MQTYYYNARTRESAWSKPDNAKIITQAEMEAMAASGQPLPGSSPAANRSGPTSMSHTPTSQGMSTAVSVIDSCSVTNTGLLLLQLLHICSVSLIFDIVVLNAN